MSQSWMSAGEIAAPLGVTKDTVYSWISDRGIRANKIRRLWELQAHGVDESVRRGGASTSPRGDAT